MSKIIARLGTTALKYQFAIVLESLQMTKDAQCALFGKWTRGPRTSTTIEARSTRPGYENVCTTREMIE